jgi:AcrR family transcriptional regulator
MSPHQDTNPAEAATSTRPRWERRKQARPAELVAAALDLFVEKGYAGTRLEDVAAHAGVSKGTLYLYFDNKEELFKAVVRDSIVAQISAVAQEVQRFDGPSDELLRHVVLAWWREFGATTAGGISKLMMAESGNFPEIARFFLHEVIEPWHHVLGQTIERGIRRGEFRRVDVASFVQVMSAPMVMLSLWTRSFGPCSGQPIDAEKYIATLLDTLVVSLTASRPARAGGADAAPARPARRARR